MAENQSCQRLDMLFNSSALLNYQILQICYTVLAALTTLTNAIVLFAFYRLSYFRTNHYRFLITLTLTDLFTGLFVLPVVSSDFYFLSRKVNDCDLSTVTRLLGFALIFMSVTTIVLINGQQYCKIVRPFYQCNLQPWQIFLALFTVWGIFLLILILSLYVYADSMFRHFKIACSVTIILIFCIMCYTQVQINRAVHLMASRENSTKGNTESSRMVLRTSRMAKSILIVFGICFSPTVLISVIQMLLPDSVAYTSTYFRSWSYFFTYLNPFLDPVVYCIRMKSVRRCIMNCFKRGSNVEHEFVTEVIDCSQVPSSSSTTAKNNQIHSFTNQCFVTECINN